MSTTCRRIALYFAFLTPLSTQLHAQNGSNVQNNRPPISSLSTEAFQQRVKDLGFVTEMGTVSGGADTYFTFRAEGRKVVGYALNRDTLELFVSFTDGAALETMNEWNRTHYGSSAFVDQKGNAALRSDLALTGGVSPECIDSFIIRFRDIAVAYARYIVDHKNKS